MYRLTCVFIVLAVGIFQGHCELTSSAASSDESGGFVKSLWRQVTGKVPQAKSYENSRLLDRITVDMVGDIMKAMVDSTCLPSVEVINNRGRRKLMLTEGEVHDMDVIYTTPTHVLSRNPSGQEFQMRFEFDNIVVKYKFEYTSNLFGTDLKTSGIVILSLHRRIAMIVHATVPATKDSQLENLMKGGKCYVNVLSVKPKRFGEGVKTIVKSWKRDFSWRSVFSYILLSLWPSTWTVKSMVSHLRASILKDVRWAIQDVFNEAISNNKVVCSNNEVVKRHDCSQTNVITE